MTVGFIGLGNMGLPMARHLLKKGFELHVHTRTRAKAESLEGEGARIADSPADLAARADVVLACLPDPSASEEVFLSGRGIASAARPGQILIDHSTVGPELSRACYRAASQKAAHFLDAPISGGPGGAHAGTLTIMVGGDERAFDRSLPVFRALGDTVVHMGGPGAGSVSKLVNQLLVGVNTMASCEALLLGIRSGIDPEQLGHVLMGAWGASRMLERNAPLIAKREFGPSPAPIRHFVKDLNLVLGLAERMGLALPATTQAARLNRAAADAGMAALDLAAVYQLLEREAVTSVPDSPDDVPANRSQGEATEAQPCETPRDLREW